MKNESQMKHESSPNQLLKCAMSDPIILGNLNLVDARLKASQWSGKWESCAFSKKNTFNVCNWDQKI